MVQTIALRAYGLVRHPTDERAFTELQEGCPGLSQTLEKLQSKPLSSWDEQSTSCPA